MPIDMKRRWKLYWTRYWCFRSQKREKRIVPAARSEGASGPVSSWPPVGLALAPPSSPASFINSSAQSPASFSLSLSAASASMYSPGPANTMFTIGPYAHETQLVSPPVFSTFTTEPSTAPFTPPPELAHLTTPSSPDVPFAQYIASSLEAKTFRRRDTISPLSTSTLTSTLASPCDTPACYTPTSGNVYLGSPVGHTATSGNVYLGSPVGRMISSTPGYSSRELGTAERLASASAHTDESLFPSFDPFTSPTFDGIPFAAFVLPSDKDSNQPPSIIERFDPHLQHEEKPDEGSNIIPKPDVELEAKNQHQNLFYVTTEMREYDQLPHQVSQCCEVSKATSGVVCDGNQMQTEGTGLVSNEPKVTPIANVDRDQMPIEETVLASNDSKSTPSPNKGDYCTPTREPQLTAEKLPNVNGDKDCMEVS